MSFFPYNTEIYQYNIPPIALLTKKLKVLLANNPIYTVATWNNFQVQELNPLKSVSYDTIVLHATSYMYH